MVISTEHLTYTYSAGTPFEKVAVRDVSLTIGGGEMVGVIGHTGSGKSTLIQHLNGLLKPTSGRVLLDGRDIWGEGSDIRQVRFHVGLVFQYPEYQLFEETVYKDIAFGPKNMGLDDKEIDKRVHEAAEFAGLPAELLDKSPFELSGGQKRRAAIAGVIAMEPEILILDEPAAGLDPRGRNKILQQIREYHAFTGNTVLLVSHSMEDVANFADKILVMNNAEIFAYDTVEKVFARSEELKKIRLSVPQVTSVFHRLAADGLPVPENVYTVPYAKKKLLRLLGKEGQGDA
ncbi:MAG TPA: energy-coupling factor transporter ATPase [Candidatus Faecivivens stercoravium]|uniref:Energy-coupling factor transporter ATP-binding protein EcfA2 n=1 Tax=Candidatus Faecivivens stercoravium TaxID=2840803 RepID=A0A9D1DXD6_9FIRM|nr:energy-coupling factor transporter ATPase [Candidatus Faecivivens stercoravium]